MNGMVAPIYGVASDWAGCLSPRERGAGGVAVPALSIWRVDTRVPDRLGIPDLRLARDLPLIPIVFVPLTEA